MPYALSLTKLLVLVLCFCVIRKKTYCFVLFSAKVFLLVCKQWVLVWNALRGDSLVVLLVLTSPKLKFWLQRRRNTILFNEVVNFALSLLFFLYLLRFVFHVLKLQLCSVFLKMLTNNFQLPIVLSVHQTTLTTTQTEIIIFHLPQLLFFSNF